VHRRLLALALHLLLLLLRLLPALCLVPALPPGSQRT
jgi:hypothetical protein